MQYMTRQMVARTELRHEGRILGPGDAFDATEVDANYYSRSGAADFLQKQEEAKAESKPEPKPEVKPDPPEVQHAAETVNAEAAEVVGDADPDPVYSEGAPRPRRQYIRRTPAADK